MQRRAASIGATFSIETAKEKGTTIQVCVAVSNRSLGVDRRHDFFWGLRVQREFPANATVPIVISTSI